MPATSNYVNYFNKNGMFRSIFPNPGGYSANAVNFDGITTVMATSGGLTGIVDGPTGTISAWIKFNDSYNGGINQYQQIFGISGLEFTLARTGSNWGANAAIGLGLAQLPIGPSQTLRIRTNTLYPNPTGWLHILASWNTNAAPDRAINLLINGVSDFTSGGDNNSFLIDYATHNYTMGGGAPQTERGAMDASDFWFSTEYLDVNQESVSEKFVDSNGKPVFLGNNGELPSGNQPVVFFSGDASQWNINKGFGQGFNKVEPLTNSLTSPSD